MEAQLADMRPHASSGLEQVRGGELKVEGTSIRITLGELFVELDRV